MTHHPLILDLEGWPVTVVGGGDAAATIIKELLLAGAEVTVISPELTTELQEQARDGSIRWLERPYVEGDLEGARLVYAATAEADVNRGVADEAARLQIPANILDDPTHSTFLETASFRRGPLTVAISAGGAGDILDDRLRRRLELEIPPLYGAVADIVHRYRVKARDQITDKKERNAFLRELVAFLDGPEVHEDLARGHLDGALAGAHELLKKHARLARSQ